jgi:hypothetical protein
LVAARKLGDKIIDGFGSASRENARSGLTHSNHSSCRRSKLVSSSVFLYPWGCTVGSILLYLSNRVNRLSSEGKQIITAGVCSGSSPDRLPTNSETSNSLPATRKQPPKRSYPRVMQPLPADIAVEKCSIGLELGSTRRFMQGALCRLFSALEAFICPHVAPLSISPAVGDAKLIKVALYGFECG